MDNTELHYLTYDPEAIYEAMVGAYMENGGDAIAPGSEIDIYLHGVLAVMVRAFAGMDNALRMSTLRYAVGEYLDMIGENRFCERHKAVHAESRVSVNVSGTASTTLPAGTILTVDGSMMWETTEDALVEVGYGASVKIRCMEAGEAGNVLKRNEEMQLIVPNDAIGTIKCTLDAFGGAKAEEDDAYRERIRRSGLYGSTTGTKIQYENKASEVEGVKDVHAWSQTPGEVTITVLPERGVSSDDLVKKVQDVVSAVDVKPITDVVKTELVTYRSFTLNVYYKLPNEFTPDIGGSMNNVINEYVEWQNSKIGRAYNPQRLVGMLYALGLESVTLTGDKDRVEIGEGECCNLWIQWVMPEGGLPVLPVSE